MALAGDCSVCRTSTHGARDNAGRWLDRLTDFAQFIGVCSSVDTCSKEEGRGKGRGEKAYKAIAEEQRALHSRGEAAYTVNGLQRVQRTVSRELYNNARD